MHESEVRMDWRSVAVSLLCGLRIDLLKRTSGRMGVREAEETRTRSPRGRGKRIW